MKEILKEQGTEVKWGDILIVRSGWMKEYFRLEKEELAKLTSEQEPPVCGVEQTGECLQCEFCIFRQSFLIPAGERMRTTDIWKQGSGRIFQQWLEIIRHLNGKIPLEPST